MPGLVKQRRLLEVALIDKTIEVRSAGHDQGQARPDLFNAVH
jgi:hypothetical protein